MPTKPLPKNPSIEHLRKQARRLLRAARSGDPEALSMIGEHHPRPHGPADVALADAQLVVARGYGFASWQRLVHHVEAVARLAWDPMSARGELVGADRLIRLACLDYGRWSPLDLEEAEQLLEREPALGRASVHAAAATGEAGALREMIARDPALVGAAGGPYRWPPLMYACYSRLAPDGQRSTLEAARLLLAAGADPNAGFLWCGEVPPFTALTGAFGEGEDGNNQPPHPERDALARALLAAGADPNDEQTLYNRHFRPDDGHLVLLFEFGLGQDRGGPWLRRFAGRMHDPPRMLVEELWSAARKNYRARVELLVTHGVDPNAAGLRDGKTAYQAALAHGNREIADYLAAHGARRDPLPVDQQLAAALVAGRAEEARVLLAAHPELRESLGRRGRVELVRRAVEGRRPEGVRLMASLGFELDGGGGATPLHQAAWAGDVAMARMLVELGASTDERDPVHRGTPLDWAAHNQQTEVAAYLSQFAGVFSALRADGLERVAQLLAADPALARAVDENGDPLVFHLHRGMKRLGEAIALLRAHGADFAARDHLGRTLAEALEARGDRAVAALLG